MAQLRGDRSVNLAPDRRYYHRKRYREFAVANLPWTRLFADGSVHSTGSATFTNVDTIWDNRQARLMSERDFRDKLANRSPGFYRNGVGSDRGGPLIMSNSGFTSVLYHGPYSTVSGRGWVTPTSSVKPQWLGPSFAPLDKIELWSYGAKAIAATKPGQPDFSAPTFIGELREGLPRMAGMSLLRDRVDIARRSGREYLNVEFGWRPLIDDLRAIGRTIKDSSEIRASYLRGSGALQRRSWGLPEETLSGISTVSGTAWYAGNTVTCNTTASWTQTKRVWFRGRFRYYIADGDDIAARFERWNQYGNRLAGLSYHDLPSTVWELAPWSWFVDWFADVGDLISNIGLLGHDGVLLDYGYLMCEQEAATQVRMTPFGGSYPVAGKAVGFDYRIRWRQRGRASPYGFGLRDTDLSARQLAILAALGIDRRSYLEN